MKSKAIMSAILVCIQVIILLTGCAGNGHGENATFVLSHYSGVDSSEVYDTELLYKNKSDVWGSDACVIYVPKERDKVYGGYYYMYLSTNAGIDSNQSTFVGEDGEIYRESTQVLRSKDLVDWEICGAVDSGMGVLIEEDGWVHNMTWAPEVIYDEESGKYFMYFSARVQELTERLKSLGARYKNYYLADGSHDINSEMNVGIAVSNTPVGPFRLVSSENVYGSVDATNPLGEVLTAINPPIIFAEHYKNADEFSAIDIHPFKDENDDLYLFFVKHQSATSSASGNDEQTGNMIWAIKMLDYVTPDYTTLTKLIANKYFVSVEYKGKEQTVWDDNYPKYLDSSYDHITSFPDGTEYNETPNDGSVCEAPQVIMTKDSDGRTVYLLTYSVRGVGLVNYDVQYAYSYSPLGPYTKAAATEGKLIIGYDATNDFSKNLGHHCFVTVGDETWIVHSDQDPGFDTRAYALASVSWQWRSFAQADGGKREILIPVANGPTKTLQPLPESVSGYRNVASEADVSVSSGSGAKYLTDGTVTTTAFVSDMEFKTNEDSVVIELKFDEPQTIRGIYLYNSYTYSYAFQSIDYIKFTLAETPDCYKGGTADSCIIYDLEVDPWTINEKNNEIRTGGGAVATFDEITVSAIKIQISNKVAGEYADGIGVSDIYVLGK